MNQTNLLCFSGGTSPDTENDFLLAQMIQLEYDKEYDRSIDSMEKRYNGESKGGPSLYIKMICIAPQTQFCSCLDSILYL